MRKIKTSDTEISASADLTIIHRIPADELESMAGIYSLALYGIHEAIRLRKESEAARRSIRLKIVNAADHYRRDCLAFRRWKRRGATLKAIAASARINQNMAREMMKHGNALARSRLADAKKAYLIELYRNGVGPRPAARMTAARFDHCAPSYAAKIIKGYKQAIQPELPLKILRSIK